MPLHAAPAEGVRRTSQAASARRRPPGGGPSRVEALPSASGVGSLEPSTRGTLGTFCGDRGSCGTPERLPASSFSSGGSSTAATREGFDEPRGASAKRLFEFLRCSKVRLGTEPAELPQGFATELCECLEHVCAEDVGVGWSTIAELPSEAGVGYSGVHCGRELTVCVFVMRKGSKIPLHDHPGMWVFGRLLLGKLRVRSFDPDGQLRTAPLPAQLRADLVLGPSPTTFSLGPEEGNLHELEAVEDCAFLDVLTPSYDPQHERDCTYFTVEDNDLSVGAWTTLAEGKLAHFSMHALRYEGPACRI